MTHIRRPDDLDRLAHRAKAAELWASFTTNEKNLVRFGMFPAEKMRTAELDYDGHLLTVALMDCAKADGGMRA
jgi:hypothetical protein